MHTEVASELSREYSEQAKDKQVNIFRRNFRGKIEITESNIQGYFWGLLRCRINDFLAHPQVFKVRVNVIGLDQNTKEEWYGKDPDPLQGWWGASLCGLITEQEDQILLFPEGFQCLQPDFLIMCVCLSSRIQHLPLSYGLWTLKFPELHDLCHLIHPALWGSVITWKKAPL